MNFDEVYCSSYLFTNNIYCNYIYYFLFFAISIVECTALMNLTGKCRIVLNAKKTKKKTMKKVIGVEKSNEINLDEVIYLPILFIVTSISIVECTALTIFNVAYEY